MSEKKFYPIVFDEQSFDAIKDCVAWCANNRPLEPSDRTYLMDLSNDLAPHVGSFYSEVFMCPNDESKAQPDLYTGDLTPDQIGQMIACLQQTSEEKSQSNRITAEDILNYTENTVRAGQGKVICSGSCGCSKEANS